LTGEMGRWGDREIGRWGDREMGRWGDGEEFSQSMVNSQHSCPQNSVGASFVTSVVR